MTATIPTTEPEVITVGDTLKFKRYHGDYLPASGWTLTYTLVNSGAQIQFSGSDNGDGYHLINVAPATTAAWTSGSYRWQATVSDGTDRHTVGRGRIELRADFDAEAAGLDARTTWRKILDQLEAAYAAMDAGTLTAASISYGDRTVTYRDLTDLIAAIHNARAQVRREDQEAALRDGIGTGNRVHIRF